MNSESFYRHGTALLSAMANEKRLRILSLLMDREVSVGEIADFVELSQSAASQHLRILRMHHLVRSRRYSQSIFYYGPSIAVRRVMAALAEDPNTLAGSTGSEGGP